uniref:Uncharacterized protein n=1 Tax=Ananas comosus var. bracteatus TaxID=296719 RepID=A0A6V7PHU1_ANACO|nr:unnamed protein product [Ananas comosus var. bracteatus]
MGSRHRRRHSPAPAPPSAARRGWVAIRVGAEGEERRRFVVPVGFVNHPLFAGLLREAEEEFGFQHDGALTLPAASTTSAASTPPSTATSPPPPLPLPACFRVS